MKLNIEQKFLKDIERIKQIPIVPTLLEVICQSTEMGFAAIARVTEHKWIACGVRDGIEFGLTPGAELQIETTICNEVQQNHEPVIIDDVDKNDHYCNHHTPKMYGFKSYISVPIIQKNGEFFCTLCAIDTKPALLNNPKVIGMFKLFAELISFHLDGLVLIEKSKAAVQDLNQQLLHSADENRQYQYISNHNLQEPLRKLRVFSDILLNAIDNKNDNKAKEFALKIDSSAQRFSMMIQDLSDYKYIDQDDAAFEEVDLNKVVNDVCLQLQLKFEAVNAVIKIGTLPLVHAITIQMEQLFYHLINNAIKFSKDTTPLKLSIYTVPPGIDQVKFQSTSNKVQEYTEIRIQDNGIGIEQLHLEKIFDIFVKGDYDRSMEGGGIGLSYCRKIVRNHKGLIFAQSEYNNGATFSVIIPLASGHSYQ